MYSITPTDLLSASEAFDKLHITQQKLDQWENEGKIISFTDDYGNKQYYFHELAGWQTQEKIISQPFS